MESNNKRIAKNTLFLYFRMLLVMGVTLYTSRVVLEVLGVDDYGIYNIVGGVVVLFSFLRSTIATALQRYLNNALGRNDLEREKQIFSSSFVILVAFSIILIILFETLGLWLINEKLNIPEDKIWETNVVYQISIVTFILNLVRVPYDALIMAHERMSFYAWASIIEVVLKLLIVYILNVVAFNKLELYSVLILFVTVIVNIIYIIYCRIDYALPILGYSNRSIIKELSNFSGWNVFGGVADIGYQQGTNIILNIFYGVAFNATMGITNQVKNAIYGFVRNVQVAVNPQLYQTFAAGEYDQFRKLLVQSSKFIYFLYLVIAVPLCMNIEFILNLWLNDIPPMTSTFCILMILFGLVDAFVGPLWTAAQAEGDIKKYQIVTSGILLMNLPLTCIAFKMGYPPYSLLLIQIVVCAISLIYRILYSCHKNMFVISYYLNSVILPTSAVTIIAFVSVFVIDYMIPVYGWKRMFINTPMMLILMVSSIWVIGLNKSEKKVIHSLITRKLIGNKN